MPKQMRLSISFKTDYETEFRFLKNCINSSDFICRAVRFMLQAETNKSDNIETCVFKALSSYFNSSNYQVAPAGLAKSTYTSSSGDSSISTDDVDLISTISALEW